MMAFIRKGALEAFQEAQANGYNYLHLHVTAFPLNHDDVEINISISGLSKAIKEIKEKKEKCSKFTF